MLDKFAKGLGKSLGDTLTNEDFLKGLALMGATIYTAGAVNPGTVGAASGAGAGAAGAGAAGSSAAAMGSQEALKAQLAPSFMGPPTKEALALGAGSGGAGGAAASPGFWSQTGDFIRTPAGSQLAGAGLLTTGGILQANAEAEAAAKRAEIEAQIEAAKLRSQGGQAFGQGIAQAGAGSSQSILASLARALG